MDLREVKTRRAIYNAFMKLRSENPLESIKIKELIEEAEISKATFYLHYKDIYDLSDQLQKELIDEILRCVSDPALFLTSPRQSFKELLKEFHKQHTRVSILFSGSQEMRLADLFECEMKNAIFRSRPELKDDLETNIRLSYQIFGAFCSHHANKDHFSPSDIFEELLKFLDNSK